jgi:hypothetical protein
MIKYTYVISIDKKTLHSRVLSRRDFKQTGIWVELRAGTRLVSLKGVGGNKRESGSCDVVVNQYNSLCHFLCLAVDAPVSTIPELTSAVHVT